MNVHFTVDVEHDCPPYLRTWRGIEEGLPKLLAALAEEQVRATLFTTGDVARRYPDAIAAAVAGGHEIGCHGDVHNCYADMSREEADRDIAAASAALRPLAAVSSFRAPYLSFPSPYVELLARHGYKVDSSEGRHKQWPLRVREQHGVRRVPASASSLTLRWPAWARNALFTRFRDPIVLLCHPWEFVDLRRDALRWDCRIRTGAEALVAVRTAIQFFKRRGASFSVIRDCAAV